MKGFILAAGFGQRMLPITHALPKPLLPVAGTPLVGYSIGLLVQAGITDIIINVHHLAGTIMDALGDGSAWGCTLTYSHEAEILGTGGALKRMHEALDETFVVINSDILVDVDLTALIAEHRARQALGTLLLREPDPSQQALGRIGIDRQGRVVDILGQQAPEMSKPWPMQQALMFTGVHVLEPKFLDYTPHNVHSDVIRYGYTKALLNGEPLYGAVSDGYWADAGTPQTYLQANQDMLTEPGRLRHIKPLQRYSLHPKRDVADVVCMGDDVHLGAHTSLKPPVLLGTGCKTGDHSTLGPFVTLGDGVHIGKNVNLARCMVLPHTKIPAGASFDGALIGPDGVLPLLG
jgi:NDP-sugar pyrophosphorylase family protein